MFTFFGRRITLETDYPMERVANANGAFVPNDVHCKVVYFSKKLGITSITQPMNGDYVNVATLYTGIECNH